MPKPKLAPMELPAEPTQRSWDVLKNGDELKLRAFLFREGQLYVAGRDVENQLSADDLDESTLRKVGAGASGSVYHVLHRTTRAALALKAIPIHERTHRNEIEAELQLLVSGVSHPHVIQHFGAFWRAESHEIRIAMEWMAYSLHGLSQLVSPDPEVLRCVALQLALGLRFLHEDRAIIHRDIKPANILISSDGVAKIGDFGISKCIETSSLRGASSTFIGTEAYMSPERLDTGTNTFAGDIWSFGLTLIAAAVGGGDPWRAADEASEHGVTNVYYIMRRIAENDPPRLPDHYSADAQDFIARCLTGNHTERATASELLEHPWLAGLTDAAAQETVKDSVCTITSLARRIAQAQEAATA